MNAQIAQLVEQLAFNQLVLGSSPSPRTINFKEGSLFGGCPFLFLRLFSFGVDWDIDPTEEVAFGCIRTARKVVSYTLQYGSPI